MPPRTKRKPARYEDEDDERQSHKSHKRSSSSHSSRHSRKNKERSSSRHRQPERRTHSRSPSPPIQDEAEPISMQQQLYDMQVTMLSLHQEIQQMKTSTATVTASRNATSVPSSPTHATTEEDEQGTLVNDFSMHFMPMPRPVVSAGVDIAAHVTAAMKAKIWRDEYVELHLLLPAATYHPESYTLAFEPTKTNQVGLKVNRPRPKYMTIDQWEEAFLIYMAIYTEKHHVCPQMCTYMRDIKLLAQRNANYRLYDEQFRAFRASTHCEWNTIHNGIWFQATTPVKQFNQRHNYSNAPNTRNHKQPFQVPRGFCNAFHARSQTCSQGFKCKYKHTCPNCSERHPIFNCTEKAKPRAEQQGNKLQQQQSRPNNTSQAK